MEEKTKNCSKCKRELPFSMFRWRNQTKGIKHSQCKDCEKARDKIHYAESKERRQAVLETAYFQKNRNLQIVKQARSCGCQKCGEKRDFLLEFHHIDPEQKINSIAHMIKSASEQSLQDELKKCVILCANCHREFHFLKKENKISSIQEYLGQMAYAVGAPD